MNQSGSSLLECLIASLLFLALLSEPSQLFHSFNRSLQRWSEVEAAIEELTVSRTAVDLRRDKRPDALCKEPAADQCRLESPHHLLDDAAVITRWRSEIQ